jgi:tRNA 2-thiouridine synthesizing protein B
MLHLVFQPPVETAIWERIDSEDAVVFLENAVLKLLKGSHAENMLAQKIQRFRRCCVLSDDISVRGIGFNQLIEGIEVIDYAGLVELTVDNQVVQSWT